MIESNQEHSGAGMFQIKHLGKKKCFPKGRGSTQAFLPGAFMLVNGCCVACCEELLVLLSLHKKGFNFSDSHTSCRNFPVISMGSPVHLWVSSTAC